MDQDPIKQLQSFLDERGKMLERITSIHSVLGPLRGDPSSASALQPAPNPSLDVTGIGFDAHLQTSCAVSPMKKSWRCATV